MPVRDWLDEDDGAPGSVAQRMEQMDPVEKMRQARVLLRDLLAAAQQLGDALVKAGLSPGLWRDPDSRLSDIDQQAPPITLDALLTRLTEFAAERGPTLLAGTGAALDDFEHEVRELGDMVRPLRALAQRERLKPRTSRSRKALWQALCEVPVGVALDRLNHVLRELDELTSRLRPLGAEQWQALEAALAAESDGGKAQARPPARGQPSGSLPDAAATVPSAFTGIPDEAPADPDAPTYLSSGWLPDAHPNDPTVPINPLAHASKWTAAPLWLGQHPRKWGLVLGVALLLLVGTATLTLFAQPALFSFTTAGTPTLTSAQSTQAAGQLARLPTVTPRPTATRVPPTPAGPARLTALPNPLPIGCPGTATLTLANSGGEVAQWSASASFGIGVAPSSGTLAPGASASLSVKVTAGVKQRASVTIRWPGGSTWVRVACHG